MLYVLDSSRYYFARVLNRPTPRSFRLSIALSTGAVLAVLA
jgi:hypothetical protein